MLFISSPIALNYISRVLSASKSLGSMLGRVRGVVSQGDVTEAC